MNTTAKDNFESDIHLAESMLHDMKLRLVNLLLYNLTPLTFANTEPSIIPVDGSCPAPRSRDISVT